MNVTDKLKTFEKNMATLDEVVLKLEKGDLNLSDALSVFEEGIHLYKTCHETLQSAEEKVKILVDSLEDVDKHLEPFVIEED